MVDFIKPIPKPSSGRNYDLKVFILRNSFRSLLATCPMVGDTFPPESNRLSKDEDFSSLVLTGAFGHWWKDDLLLGCQNHLATDYPVVLPPKTPPVLVSLPGFLKATIAFSPIIIEITIPNLIG